MKNKEITYFEGKKKHTLKVKPVSVFSSGLLFRKNSPPLLFSLKKERTFSIFSYFCKPFRAIWLDKHMKATKTIDVHTWKWKITGRGMYLLEIPLRSKDSSKMVHYRRENRERFK